MSFKFTELRHTMERRGVSVRGVIEYNEEPVGTFVCQPYCACIPTFTDQKAKTLFEETAKPTDTRNTTRADQLLMAAEEEIMNELEKAKNR